MFRKLILFILKLWISSINSVKNLQILTFSKKTTILKNLKMGSKKWAGFGSYTYYYIAMLLSHLHHLHVRKTNWTSHIYSYYTKFLKKKIYSNKELFFKNCLFVYFKSIFKVYINV